MEVPMGNVLKRIERHIGPERGVYEKVDRVNKLIGIFEQNSSNLMALMQEAYRTHLRYQTKGSQLPLQDERATDVLKWSHLLTSIDAGEIQLGFDKDPTLRISDKHYHQGKEITDPQLAKELSREGLQTVMAAHLFSQNRRIFKERTGSMDNYNQELEKKQLEAVIRGLEGEHQQIDTGQGKTSVILPITTLIQAYTSPEQKVIFSADSALRTEEFERFAQPLRQACSEVGLEEVKITTHKKEEIVGTDRKKTLKRRMEREAIMDPDRNSDHTLETKKAIHDTEIQVDIDRRIQHSQKILEAKGIKKQPEIEIYTHDDLVHAQQQDPSIAANKDISVYMDEAHTPFDRGTPYVVTSDESLAFSPDQCRNATAEWVLHYVASHYMDTGDIVLDMGSGMLTEKGEEKMRDIQITEIVNPNGRLYNLFSEAVHLIAKEYGIDQKDVMRLQGNIVQTTADLLQIKKTLADGEGVGDYMWSIGEKIARIYREKDELFTQTDEGKFTLRDQYQDELLASHEYERDMSLAARGIMGSFKMLIPRPNSASTTYSTFLHEMKDKVVCYSGTLKDEGKNTNFASYLETETKRKIHTIENRQKKTAPHPELAKTRELAEVQIVDGLLHDKRGFLLVSTESIEKVKAAADNLKKKLGDNMVIYIGSKPSGDLAKERKYDDFVQNTLRDLAEGKIRAVVSTGSVGVGMNIVKKDGSYPDIKIGILGVPNSKLQLKQIIGRRRAPDSTDKQDYYWSVGEDHLEKYISHYPEKHASILGALFGGSDRGDIYKQYKEARKKPKELQRFIYQLIGNAQAAIDTEYDLDYDKYYKTMTRIFQNAVTDEVLKRKFEGKKKESLSKSEQFMLQNITAHIGISSDMYQGIQRLPALMPISVDGNVKSRVVTLNKHVNESNYVASQVDEWLVMTYDAAESYVENRYTQSELDMFYKEGYGNGEFAWLDFNAALSNVQHKMMKEQVGNVPGRLGMVPIQEIPRSMLTLFKDDTSCVPVRNLNLSVITYPTEVIPAVSFNRFPVNMTNGAPLYVLNLKEEVSDNVVAA